MADRRIGLDPIQKCLLRGTRHLRQASALAAAGQSHADDGGEWVDGPPPAMTDDALADALSAAEARLWPGIAELAHGRKVLVSEPAALPCPRAPQALRACSAAVTMRTTWGGIARMRELVRWTNQREILRSSRAWQLVRALLN
jgi:hypothetical protein